MKVNSILGTVFGALIFMSCSPQSDEKVISAVVNLDSLSGRSQEVVSQLLGPGEKQGTWKDKKAGCVKCPKMSYKSGKIEVIYINQVADRVTVNDLSDYKFTDKEILGAVGLKESAPSFENDFVKRWYGLGGYREIAAFSNEGKVNYILVLSKAE